MTKLSRFDAAEYLDSNEARAEYLRAATETKDAAFIVDAIGVTARAVGRTIPFRWTDAQIIMFLGFLSIILIGIVTLVVWEVIG